MMSGNKRFSLCKWIKGNCILLVTYTGWKIFNWYLMAALLLSHLFDFFVFFWYFTWGFHCCVLVVRNWLGWEDSSLFATAISLMLTVTVTMALTSDHLIKFLDIVFDSAQFLLILVLLITVIISTAIRPGDLKS